MPPRPSRSQELVAHVSRAGSAVRPGRRAGSASCPPSARHRRGCVYLRGARLAGTRDDAGASAIPGSRPCATSPRAARASASSRPASGPPLVLVHDYLASRVAWDDVLPAPGRRASASSCRTCPGFGESEKPPPGRYRYDFEAFSESLVDLLAALGLGRVSRLRARDGGSRRADAGRDARAPRRQARPRQPARLPAAPRRPVAHRRRARSSDRSSSSSSTGGRSSARRFSSSAAAPASSTSSRSSTSRPRARPPTRPCARCSTRGRSPPACPRVTAPTLVAWGRSNRASPVEQGRRLARELRGARFEVFDCGPSPAEEVPRGVRERGHGVPRERQRELSRCSTRGPRARFCEEPVGRRGAAIVAAPGALRRSSGRSSRSTARSRATSSTASARPHARRPVRRVPARRRPHLPRRLRAPRRRGAPVARSSPSSATLIASAIGAVVGIVAGYYEGRRFARVVNVDGILMRFVDVLLAFPFLLLVMAIGAALDRTSAVTIFVILGVTGWLGDRARPARQDDAGAIARLRRGVAGARPVDAAWVMLEARAAERGRAARRQRDGARRADDRGRQRALVPRRGHLAADADLGPDALRGAGRTCVASPWLVAAPATAILLAVWGFNMLGEGLRDALDPHES